MNAKHPTNSRRLLSVSASVLALGVLGAGSAANVSATSPSSILNIAKGYGSAELEKDSNGDPKITGRIDGTRYVIYFYGCKSNANCQSIQFRAAWSDSVSLTTINEWNRDKVAGKAYLDEDGEPVLELWVNLKNGVSSENLDDTFDWWETVIDSFKEIL